MKEYPTEFAEAWYLVPTPLERAGGCWLMRAGHNRAKPDYRAGPRRIECYGLHFIMEGYLVYETRGRRFELQDGDAFCLWPGAAHMYRNARPDKPLRMIWVTTDGPQVSRLLEACGMTEEAPVLRQIVGRELAALLRGWIARLESGSHDATSRLSELYRLFHQLSRGVQEAAGEPVQSWLRRSVDYFNLHYMEQATVEEAARIAGVHRSHFSQTFARTFGIHPQGYLRRLRMEQAAKLLRESEGAVSEVGSSVGYPDLYQFTRAFTRYYGQPPTRYRAGLAAPPGGGSDRRGPHNEGANGDSNTEAVRVFHLSDRPREDASMATSRNHQGAHGIGQTEEQLSAQAQAAEALQDVNETDRDVQRAARQTSDELDEVIDT